MSKFMYVPNVDVKRVLTPAIANKVAEETLLDHYNDQIDWAIPRQTDMWARDNDTYYKVKGCVLRRLGVAGFRVGSLNRTEAGYAVASYRPTRHVFLSDSNSGEFLGLVDERWAYAIRTGSCAAIAVKHLKTEGAKTCAILGTGLMAYGALVTVNEVMPLERVAVWSRQSSRREAFVSKMSELLDAEVVATDTAEECVRAADVVVTCTTASSPFLRSEWFAPGVTIYALGGEQEVETKAYREMTFMVDDREQVLVLPDIHALAEAGEYTEDWVKSDLAEVVGSDAHGRSSDDEQILVRSQGLVTQDVAQAYWVYKEVLAQGGGISMEDGLVEKEGDPIF